MEFIRKIQFMFKGYRQFTKREQPWPQITEDMTGKTFVITGANSGIGCAAAKKIAQLNGVVYLICRNQERGKKAVSDIIKQTGNKNVYLIIGEMGEKDEMLKIYKQLTERLKQIDILVHNAGCMIHERQYTKDKLQKNFATNTFTVYYLTKLLLPLLHPESRIITVSSGGMLTQKLITDDLFMQNEKFDGTTQYARNKRQQICITEQFAKLHPNHGKFVTMHPGWVDTPALREAMPDFHKKFENSLKDEDEGADTIVYLSTMPF